MKTAPRWLALISALVVVPAIYAHPGHDGHELTWDLDHLIAHPGATLLCFSVIGTAVWGVIRLTADSKRDEKR